MNWVTDIFTPLIKFIVFVLIVGWILYIFYWILTKSVKDIGLWFKYKVLRQRYDEKVVEWCMKADDLNYTVEKVKKTLLLNGHLPKKAKEIAYIYAQVRKMKGGLKQDEQRIRESDLKTLPEIKNEGRGESS